MSGENEPDLEQRISELRREAWMLPRGATKVSLLEEAVRLADLLNDVPLAYSLRDELMDAATFSGRDDLLLVSFSWCLAQFDREPGRFGEHNILWKYKWVVGNAPDFPEISRRQIEELLDDMQRRFEKGGHSLHAVYQMRRATMVDFRDADAAREWHARFRKARRDGLSNCNACVASGTIDYYEFLGETRRALDAAKPLLEGQLVCTEEPRRAYGKALLPLLKAGRVDEAKEVHEKGYRKARDLPHAVNEFAQHLQHVVLTGDFAKARKMMERHLPSALDTINRAHRFSFFLVCRLLLDRLVAGGSKALKLRLPDSLPAPDARGRHDLAALADWFTAEARAIAERYDRRNGNTAFADEVDALPELLELALPAVKGRG